jgi:hypothetical protein
MQRTRSFWWQLLVIGSVAVCWLALCGTVLAGEEEGGGGGPKFVMNYIVVLLCIGLGVFLVCYSSKRRDRPMGVQEYKDDAASLIEAKRQVPVVLMGMRDVAVEKMLGKPKIKRRGDQIYAELAQSGQLSEEEGAKEHAIFEHPAGRYELVFLDRRVVQIKKQPTAGQPGDEAG